MNRVGTRKMKRALKLEDSGYKHAQTLKFYAHLRNKKNK